jgi:hypothetical protein
MKHPTPDQWLDYVYSEQDNSSRLDLEAHLAVCPECTRLVRGWQTTGARLDAWQITAPVAISRTARRWPWAAAAALALLLGISLGRSFSGSERVRMQIESELRAEFDHKLLAATDQLQQARQQDQRNTLNLLDQMEARRVADQARLREQMETVAVFTQSGLQRAQSQLHTLAQLTTPAGHSQP